tara:strand:+ start:9668 stop:10891 length:1224 start_codon:yes stop_codon:yes gene_type:complete
LPELFNISSKDFIVKGKNFFRVTCTLLIGFDFIGCTEPFTPESKAYKGVLVVDGFVSDAEARSTIKLTRSSPIDVAIPTPESNAIVSVIDKQGTSFEFEETSPGIYQCIAARFKGVVGQVYSLDILTDNGNHYQSGPVTLKKSPPIDSVYFEPSVRLSDIDGDTITGAAIFIDTHDDTNSTKYYRWEWEEDWEIRVPYPNTYDWITYEDGKFGFPKENGNQIGLCYNHEVGRNIHIATTNQLSSDQVSKLELNYVTTRDGYKLRSLYSILVRQYALDEAAFLYWSELEKTSETLGTLFDPQPYELRGNVFNTEDPDETVLGYFGAGTVEEKRLYITREQLKDIKYPTNPCGQDLLEVEYRYVYDHLEAGYVIAYLGDYGAISLYMAPKDCCDCRFHGVLEKPDFWPL